jgi:K+/H+ antiporter YhaU regulatory subunit KhtT
MFWALLTRPLTALLTIAGAALLAPVLVPVTAALVKPLIKPVTNLYLDIAEEMGEVVEERTRRKAYRAAEEKKTVQTESQKQDAKEIEAGAAILDKVGKIL